MNIHKVIRGKTLGRWKLSAEEDYNKTPISVLKYITVLEDELACNTDIVDPVSVCTDENDCRCERMYGKPQLDCSNSKQVEC